MQCADHEQKTADYFCVSHSIPVCAKCAVFSHERCDVNDVNLYEHQTKVLDEVSNNVQQLLQLDNATLRKIKNRVSKKAYSSKNTNDEENAKPPIDKRLERLEQNHEWYQQLAKETKPVIEEMKLKRGHPTADSKLTEDLLIKMNVKLAICLDTHVRKGSELSPEKHTPVFQSTPTLINEGKENRTDANWLKVHSEPDPKNLQQRNIGESESPLLQIMCSFSAWHITDKYHCNITGITFLKDDRIVLTDKNNQKVKLFSNEFQFLKEAILDISPFDVAVLENETICVTCPKENTIRLYSSGLEELSDQSICTDQPCLGIASQGDFCYVYCQSTWTEEDCVKIYGDTGYLHSKIPTSFCSARYIDVFPSTGGIVFTQSKKEQMHCLSCITTGLGQIWNAPVETESDIIKGVCVLGNTILACAVQNIKLYCPKRQNWVNVLASEELVWPHALTISRDNSRLAISQISPFFESQDNNMVTICQLDSNQSGN